MNNKRPNKKDRFIKVVIRLAMLLLTFVSISSRAQIILPKLISDGMVLQRNTELKIWGWASAHEAIEISFIDKTYQTRADSSGKWEVILDENEEGGPYTMVLKGKNLITIKDIVLGDVWLCSGQSNMQLPMKRIAVIYEREIAASENKNIRQFTVPVKWNYQEPQTQLQSGEWQTANPENVKKFSGAAYFFARDLYANNNVPIGILLCAAGGSCAEGWISEKSLKSFPDQYKVAMQLKDESYMQDLISSEKSASDKWFYDLVESDLGHKQVPWMSTQLDDSQWSIIDIPNKFNHSDINLQNGVVWFRKEVILPKECEGQSGLLELGRIVDSDSAFINGLFVGTTSYQYPPRRYNIAPGCLKEGKNIITVKVISQSGQGAFVANKPYQLIVGDKTFDIAGSWKFKVGAKVSASPSTTYFPGKPLGPFNAMLYPLINYKVKGVAWYQGESNTGRPNNYFDVVSTLISEWRVLFNDVNLPFLCVQLPNFKEEQSEPNESNWAMLREQQRKLQSLSNTYVISTIDLGEWNDLHPLRKKEIGERMSLMALSKVYEKKNIVCSGPVYQSMKVVDDKIEIVFDLCGSKLISSDGNELRYFAIAGADGKFIWAEAKIEGDKVLVWSKKVKNPVAVRYAWADNPQSANLYNKEGLPASPFRTDNW